MKQKIDPDQPVFSRSAAFGSGGDYDLGTEGMTLRQYYAGLAMKAYAGSSRNGNPIDYSENAKNAVNMADALIAELNKEKP